MSGINQEGSEGKTPEGAAEWQAIKTGPEPPKEFVKSVEEEKIPDYQEISAKLSSGRERALAEQDNLARIREKLNNETFNGDGVGLFKQSVENYKRWGLEPNFCGGKLLLPYRIQNDKATLNNSLSNEPISSLDEVEKSRVKMLSVLVKAGVGNIGLVSPSGYGNNEVTDRKFFPDDERGKKLYNLQIIYGNVLEAIRKGNMGVKEKDIVSILKVEAKKMGLTE
ncbi:MAG: hypothetical protein ACD_58C00092G0011 [uncultured bacterium]|nr:MAG: hypothetical protein ACD_58C00092G0011 [uncultured bacterium]